jgi:hypothetical protein
MVLSWDLKAYLICFITLFFYKEVILVYPSVEDCENAKQNVSDPWKKEDFPNPLKDPEKCGRHKDKQTFICDPDNMLTKSEADQLDELIEQILSNTTCVCGKKACGEKNESHNGFSIAIAFVNRMHHNKEFLTEADKLKLTQKFSLHLRSKSWDFGQCDNDAVIIINKEFKKAWTSTGDVFNEHLSDWCVNHIYKEKRHYLKDGNYSYALTQMIKSYKGVLQGEITTCKEGVRPGTVIFFMAMGLFASCALIAFASFLRQRFNICDDEPIKVHVEEAP